MTSLDARGGTRLLEEITRRTKYYRSRTTIRWEVGRDTKVRNCPVCGSDDIILWLGAIGTLYHCPECHYVGPIIIEANLRVSFENRELEERIFWSWIDILSQKALFRT